MAPVREGLMRTAAEKAVWITRYSSGPFNHANDFNPYGASGNTNTPGEGDKIRASALTFKNNPALDRYTNYFKGSSKTAVPQGATDPVHSGASKSDPAGIRLRDAGFHYLMTGDLSYGNLVKSELIAIMNTTYTYGTETNIRAFDWNNRSRWTASIADVNPGFTISEWLMRLMFGYDFTSNLFSATEKSTLIKWFEDAGKFFTLLIDVNGIFRDAAHGDYNASSSVASAWNDQNDGNVMYKYKIGSTIFSSPTTRKLNRQHGNKRCTMTGFVGFSGILSGNQTLIDTAKQWYKVMFMMNIYPTGYMGDLFRGTSEGKPAKGLGYSANAPMWQFIDALARTGDDSMYRFTTTKGTVNAAVNPDPKYADCGNARDPSSDGVTQKGPVMHAKATIAMRKHTAPYSIYATTDNSLVGTTAWLVDGVDRVGGKESTLDALYCLLSRWSKDVTIKEDCQRKYKNGVWPSSVIPNGSSSGWDMIFSPSILFQYMNMESVEYPYPGVIAGSPQTITFPTIGTNNTVTYGVAPITLGATADSGLPVTYSISGTISYTLVGNVLTIKGAGTLSITANQGGDSTYAAATPQTKTLTINKAPLRVTAGSGTRQYGVANPSFTLTYQDFVNSDTVSTIDTLATATTTATLSSAPGTYTVTPTGAADNNYSFTIITGTLTVTKANQALNFPTPANKLTTDPPFTVTATLTPASGLTITYSVVSGPATITGNTVTLTGATGTVVLRAAQGGDTNYNAATNVDVSFVVSASAKTAQTINAFSIADKVRGVADFAPGATATSGLTVTYLTDTPTVISIMSGNVHILKVGIAKVRAQQAGNSTYAAATDVVATFNVTKAPLTVTPNAASKTYLDPNPTLTATITGFVLGETISVVDVPPTITTIATQASVPGTYTIQGQGGADDNYSFVYPTALLTVTKRNQTISFPSISDKPLNSPDFALNATTDAGLSPTYSIVSGGATIVSGNQVHLVSQGVVVVRASSAATGLYNAATNIDVSFTVLASAKTSQTITINPVSPKIFTSAPFVITATSSANLPVTLTIVSGLGSLSASTSPATLTWTGAGDIVISATQLGDSLTFPAIETFITIPISKAPQLISWTAIQDVYLSAISFVADATTDAGLPITYVNNTPEVLLQTTEGGEHFQLLTAGLAEIIAVQTGDDNYLPAVPLTQSFNVLFDPVIDVVNVLESPTSSKKYYEVTADATLFYWDIVLNASYDFNRLVLKTGLSDTTNRIRNYKFYYWNGLAWVLVFKASNNDKTIIDINFELKTGTQVRITSIGYNFKQTDEFKIFGVSTP